ncbi:tripartite tricarboxylate transporter substrate binding protein, partial [Microbacteriaceae bacterium K1510]|nr:tripartite tricarboxylate transporter substrate binding protein [Microbacteriaceae bacterium K1510]
SNALVRFVVPFAPGGASDVMARVIAQNLKDYTIVVENRGGAGGNIGMAVVAHAAPDGRTMGVASSSMTINPSIYKDMPFDTEKAFAPVSYVASVPTVLVVHPSVPAHTVQELVTLVKSQPDKYNYASSGVGTSQHLAGELFKRRAGVEMLHIPFNGAGPATTAVLSGQVPVGFIGLPSVRGLVAQGQLRVLAVTTAKRSAMIPEVPTIAESGYPGYEVDFWQGIVMPAGTSQDVIQKISRQIADAIKVPEVRDRFDQLGLEPVGSTPEEFGQRIKRELELWGKFTKDANISLGK